MEGRTGTGRARSRREADRPDPRGPAAYGAELVGTFLLVFLICGVVSVGQNESLPLDLAGLGLTHALALMILVYAIGGTSGAHVNPAVTVGLLSVRKISSRDAVAYIVCQLIGGVLAGLLVLLLFTDVGADANYGTPALNPDVLQDGSVWLGLIAEGLGTFILMWALMGLAVNPKGESALAGVGIGGALGVAVMVFGPATGGSLNPARWLGPAIASGDFSDFWIYIVAPLIGAVAAALAYRGLVLEKRQLPPQAPRDEMPG